MRSPLRLAPNLGDITPFGAFLRALIPPTGVVIGLGLAEYRGFNKGLDIGRSIWGPWDVRDPFADMKPEHAGVVAFRSVFS